MPLKITDVYVPVNTIRHIGHRPEHAPALKRRNTTALSLGGYRSCTKNAYTGYIRTRLSTHQQSSTGVKG